VSRGLVVNLSITVNAPVAKVWAALISPNMIKKYLFGTDVVSDWKQGSPIVFRGEWQGKTYEDKGVILRLEPERLIQYSHWSNLSGLPDTPENYHVITFELAGEGSGTRLSLSQDNNPDEESREHSRKNWAMVLATFKRLLEQ
jgi:uncharacterized protein YndB with AHSA1/START domain